MKQTIALATLALVGTAVADETVVGTFIFGRHGDRLTKPTKVLSPIGSQEVYAAGNFYQQRYFVQSKDFNIPGLNSTYQPSQLNAFAPDSDVLQKSAQGFLQGLYPPLSSLAVADSTVSGSALSNGSFEDTPLGGYQYVYFTGVDAASPNNIWIQGDINCPAYTNASNGFFNSQEFLSLNQSTFDFYQSLYPLVQGVIPKSNMTFANAYTIFDYFMVNSVHNETFANLIENKQDDFEQVRTLQDIYSRWLNFNESNPDTIIGGKSMTGFILSQLNLTVTTGAPLISYAAGSYDTFYQLFGTLGLFSVNETKFTGIINYAASVVFELVDSASVKYVRFGIRNGTDASDDLEYFPILGWNSTLIPYDKFVSSLNNSSISDLGSWCNTCQGWSLDMCAIYTPQYLNAKANDFHIDTSSLTLADAGGIGAGVTIGVFALAAAVIYLLFGRKKSKSTLSPQSSNTNPGSQSSLKQDQV
jgi:prostatic aicd phosphatase